MEKDNQPAPAATDPAAVDPPKGDPPVKTLTQEQVDQIVIREKQQASRAAKQKAEADLAEQLGVPIADAAKLIADAKAKADAEKSDAEKAKEAAEAARAEAEKERHAAQSERHAIKVERALIAAGAQVEKIERLARLVDAEVGADDDAVKAATETVKTEFPELFAGKSSSNSGPVSGDPPGNPTKPKANGAGSHGAELAKKYNERRGVKVS